MPFSEENKTLVEGIPEVETYVVRTTWPARLYNDTMKVAGLVGIETNRDWEFAGYNITGARNIQGTNVVIGNMLAENHHLKIGDTFNLTIKAYDTEAWNRTYSLSVIGIYCPTPPATSVDIFIGLPEAQNMSGLTGMVGSILVKVETGKAAEVREELRKRLQPEFDVVAPRVEEQPMSESKLISYAAEKTHFDGMDNAFLFFVNLKSDYKDKADEVVRKIDTTYPDYDFGKRSMAFQGLLSQVKANIDQLFSIFLLGLYMAILIGTMACMHANRAPKVARHDPQPNSLPLPNRSHLCQSTRLSHRIAKRSSHTESGHGHCRHHWILAPLYCTMVLHRSIDNIRFDSSHCRRIIPSLQSLEA
jgi:hypothetical protein